MEQRRQEFYATVRFVRETLEEIMGSEPYPLHFHILGFDQEFREWPFRSTLYAEHIAKISVFQSKYVVGILLKIHK